MKKYSVYTEGAEIHLESERNKATSILLNLYRLSALNGFQNANP